jgi:hypothetical protein
MTQIYEQKFQQKLQLIVKIDRMENFEQQLSKSKPMSVKENGENCYLLKRCCSK